MTLDELERVERTTLEMVVQALTDYGQQAKTIFREETDLPQDIAEDVTREAVEAMGMPGLGHRLYGKVDFKKAIYVFLPAAMPVALMLDAKAESPMETERPPFRCPRPRCVCECGAVVRSLTSPACSTRRSPVAERSFKW